MRRSPPPRRRPGESLRTLVVSDLHLGAAPGNDLLRVRSVREPLVERLRDCGRLVLLGDVLELRHGPAHQALASARAALYEVVAALKPPHEIVVVPGNHDHQLLSPWLQRRASVSGTTLALESEVDWREGEVLGALAAALEPARLRSAYPGVWVREDVYATHGHYSDRHNTVPLLERLGAGAVARIVGEPPGGPASAEDYEETLAPMYSLIDGVVRRRPPRLHPGRNTFQVRAWQRLREPDGRTPLRKAVLQGAFSGAVAGLNRAGLGPLRADLSGTALREGGLYGMREVVRRLEIPAEHVVFGHTHRAGPMPGDRPEWWRAPTGQFLWNTGSWLLERSFLGSEVGESPYRPGFCAVVEETGPPQVINLLDGMSVENIASLSEARREADRVTAHAL